MELSLEPAVTRMDFGIESNRDKVTTRSDVRD